MEKDSLLSFNQPPNNYLKVSVEKNDHNLTKLDKNQKIDTRVTKIGTTGGYLMQQWNINCHDKNNAEK